MDIRVHAVERGFGHGLVHMFAEDGSLLATASQSVIVHFALSLSTPSRSSSPKTSSSQGSITPGSV